MNDEAKIIKLSDHINNNLKVESGNIESSINVKAIPEPKLITRSYAFMIDFCAIIFINYLVFSAYMMFLDYALPTIPPESKYKLLTGKMSLNLSIFLTIYWSYFLYTSYIMRGKTLGKKALGLTIINEDFVVNQHEKNYAIELRQCFQRASGYLLAYLSFGTFFIFNFASEDKRGLSDYLSSTRTVDDKWLNAMVEHKEFSSEELRIDIRSLKKAA